MLAHLGAMWAQACGPCWAIWGLCWASLRPFWGVCWAMLTHLDPQDRKNGICFYISPMERRECHTAVPWPRGLGPWPYRATPPVTDPKRLWAWRAGGRQHRHVNTDVKRFFLQGGDPPNTKTTTGEIIASWKEKSSCQGSKRAASPHSNSRALKDGTGFRATAGTA